MKTDKIVDHKGVAKDKGIKDPFVLRYCANLIARYVDIINKQDISCWTVDEVVNYLKSGTSDVCFSDYAREYQSKMIQEGHARNARTYELAYENLERFIGTTKVMFSHLTSSVITKWINSLSNTARAKEQYPVCVRQIFKQALVDYNDYDAGIIRITTTDISITVTTRSHTTTPFYNGAVEIKEQYIVQSNVFSVTIIAGKRIQCGNLQK